MIRIKELRESAGLSQKELSTQIGIAQNTLSQYETGKREPDYATLSKIADYFDVSTDYLLGKTDKKKPLINGDEELTEYLEELKNRDELRMLFSLTKRATKADVEKAVKIIEALLRN